MKRNSLDVAILLIIFNRPDFVSQIFEKIKTSETSRLYVFCDGPRNSKEQKVLSKSKLIAMDINWDCKLKTKFLRKNIGPAIAVSEAIAWFFKNEEMGIILEHDCVPDQSFFPFCEELLHKYKNDEKIMHISGDNYQYNGGIKVKESYFFAKYTHIWGWATWRRAWKKHDLYLTKWPMVKNSPKFDSLFDSVAEKTRFYKWFDEIYTNPISTWDTQWLFACWLNKGLAIYPNKNLIKYIGFHSKAVNTTVSRGFIIKTPVETMHFPLEHPKKISRNIAADKFTFYRWFYRGIILKTFYLMPPKLKNLSIKIYSVFLKIRYEKNS